MKNIKYIIFVFISLFFNVFYVQAQCTNNEINELKKLADDIKITYKHMGVIKTDDYIDYNSFNVTVKNFSDNLYITYLDGTNKILPKNGTASVTLSNGDWEFRVFSNKCDDEISLINVHLPKFNMYSLDPLCDGIDGDDFPLCGKYYEYDVSYESFVERVNYYRSIHHISNNDDIDDSDSNHVTVILNKILDYIFNYRLYIFISLVIILVILIIIIIIKRRKKRGVLV